LIAIKWRPYRDVAALCLMDHNQPQAEMQQVSRIMNDDFASPRDIARLNIEHYGKLLSSPLDEQTRRTVEKLLADERAKLAELSGNADPASEASD
jgi:hypothetical protein